MANEKAFEMKNLFVLLLEKVFLFLSAIIFYATHTQ